MFKQKNIYILILGLFVFLSCSLSSLAQNYENNLLKTDISQNALGQVKVTLSTKKPYNDKVIVNKKSDTEYVILMPETSNSMTAEPVTKNAQGVVSSVDVKTQPYQGNLKGYTKITVKTTRPVEVVSSVRTSTESAISQSEYNQLMAQTKKAQLSTTSVNKTVQNIAKQNVSAAKTTVGKVQNKVISVTKNNKNISNVIDKSKKVIDKNNLISQKSQPKKVQQKTVSKPVETKNVQKQTVKKEEPKAKPQEKVVEQPKDTTQNEVNNENVQVLQNETQETVQESAQENVSEQENVEVANDEPVAQAEPQKSSIVVKLAHIIDYILRFVRNNIILASAVGLLVFLILISFVKKMQRASISMKQSIKANMKDEKAPVDYTENITEEMSWKEKFNTVQEQEQKVAQLQKGIENAKNDLNELFVENEIEQDDDEFSSVVLGDDEEVIGDDIYTDERSSLVEQENVLNDVEEQIAEQELQEEYTTEAYSDIEEQAEPVNEQIIDEQFENIEEEIEVLPKDNLISEDIIYDAQQDLIPEETMEAEDVFNDISEDEIQEQVLNSMQQESLIDTNDFEDMTDDFSDGTSIEDLFEEENTEDNSLDSVREKYELEQEQRRIEAEKQAMKEAKAAREAELKAKEIAKHVIEEGAVTNSVMNIVKDDLIAQHAISQPTNSIEEVKYSADIDDTKGFYLVDLNGASALIGHINDEIFVIKQFDNIVSSPIKIRVNETTPNGISYMARVGSFRGVVEVSDYNMKLLIEL